MRDRLTVTLRNLRFSALVGVLPHEREIPQPIEVDVTVSCDPLVCTPPYRLESVVDYRALYDIARDSAAGRHTELLEQIADRISGRLMALPAVTRSIVAVRKPGAAVGGELDFAEVVLDRGADD